MPFVLIQLIEGRTSEQKSALVAAVTDAVVRALGDTTAADVMITLEDVPKSHFAVGGRLLSD